MGLLKEMFFGKNKEPVFNGKAAEVVYDEAEAEGKNSAEGLWFVNSATRAMGIANTAEVDIQTVIQIKEDEATKHEEKAEAIISEAKEEAEELRRQAEVTEKSGQFDAEMARNRVKAATARKNRLAKIAECL